MYKKTFISLFLLFIAICHAQIPNEILSTPALTGIFDGPGGGVAITPNGEYAYVTNGAGTTVSVIQISNNTLYATISGFDLPQGIAITPDGQYAYVTNEAGTTVSVIDLRPASPTYNQIVSTITVSGQPFVITITPNGDYAYVSNVAYVINVIKTSDNTVLVTPGLTNTFREPNGIAITPDNLFAYAADSQENTVSVIDIDPSSANYNTIKEVITGFSYPDIIAITPDGQYAYVANAGNSGGCVSVIDLRPASSTYNQILSTPGLTTGFNEPRGLAITPDGQYVYVTNTNGNSVSVIQISSNTILSTPGLTSGFDEPFAVAVTPDGQYVYVADFGANSVVVLYSPAPLNASGCKRKDNFLTQTDNYNHLTWSAPEAGSPAAYQIYRDAALTQLVATVPASGILQYDDHNRNPNVNYTYYIVAVDASGNLSSPAVTTVTQSC